MQRRFSEISLILLTFASLGLVLTTIGAINISTTINSSGTIIATSSNLGIYTDYACTNQLRTLDWGTLSPGDTVTRTFYIKNEITSPITLAMTATNWNPPAADGPLSISWNRQSTILLPGQSTSATLSLTISPAATSITSFSVQIALTGTA